ncbi:MAG: HAD hydrolase family protein [Clostridiales Family XIII bacterium]|jgi:hydroxymethylpyrimidine pyrophosphatase-like HAD family hydrolase|nr:HAD hydrolase family protein [Clostridiales Family XIII bacterium]
MSFQKAKLIALDIDGTILDKPAGIPVPEAVCAAVADAHKAGARVCLCSSRPCYMMEDAVSKLGGIDAAVGCGGAVIFICGGAARASGGGALASSASGTAVSPASGGGALASSARGTAVSPSSCGTLAPGAGGEAVSLSSCASARASARMPFYADTLPVPLLFSALETAKKLDAFVTYAAMGRMLVRRKGPFGAAAAAKGDSALVVMDEPELVKALAAEPIYSAYLFTKPDTPVAALAAAALTAPALASASILRSSENCFIITNKGTDKGSALLRLAEYFAIPAAEILAVGNDANDIPMFRVAGTSVAVENASTEARAAAGHIAPGVAQAGAAEAIRRFAL